MPESRKSVNWEMLSVVAAILSLIISGIALGFTYSADTRAKASLEMELHTMLMTERAPLEGGYTEWVNSDKKETAKRKWTAARIRYLNSYDLACFMYKTGKVNPVDFRNNYGLVISDIIENEEYADLIQRKDGTGDLLYGNIWDVYTEWYPFICPPDLFRRTWSGCIASRDANRVWHEDYYEIEFLYGSACAVTVTTYEDGKTRRQEAKGTWAYNDHALTLDVTFVTPRVARLPALHWRFDYEFHDAGRRLELREVDPKPGDVIRAITFHAKDEPDTPSLTAP